MQVARWVVDRVTSATAVVFFEVRTKPTKPGSCNEKCKYRCDQSGSGRRYLVKVYFNACSSHHELLVGPELDEGYAESDCETVTLHALSGDMSRGWYLQVRAAFVGLPRLIRSRKPGASDPAASWYRHLSTMKHHTVSPTVLSESLPAWKVNRRFQPHPLRTS